MSDEEALPATGATQRPEVVDPHNIPPLFVDWIITGGLFEGVVNITLGSIDHALTGGGGDMPRIAVAARLRFSRDFALRLHAALGNTLGLPPAEAEVGLTAGPAKPPKNTLN